MILLRSLLSLSLCFSPSLGKHALKQFSDDITSPFHGQVHSAKTWGTFSCNLRKSRLTPSFFQSHLPDGQQLVVLKHHQFATLVLGVLRGWCALPPQAPTHGNWFPTPSRSSNPAPATVGPEPKGLGYLVWAAFCQRMIDYTLAPMTWNHIFKAKFI